MAAPDAIPLGHEIESQFARARNYIDAVIEVSTVRAARAVAETLYSGYIAVNEKLPWGYRIAPQRGPDWFDILIARCDYIGSLAYIVKHRRLFY